MKGLWMVLVACAVVQAEDKKAMTLNLQVMEDRDLARILPSKHLFENIEGKLFRSNDGKRLYLGPGPDKSFFIITGRGKKKIRRVEAPSAGKAYMDPQGRFVAWYDQLETGIHFKDGEHLTVRNPVGFRFGVSYDADYCYLQQGKRSRVYRMADRKKAIIEREQFFLYRIVAHGDRMFLLGFQTLDTAEVRSHLCLEYAEINGTWREMKETRIREKLTLLDVNPQGRSLLLLKESKSAPSLMELDLTSRNYKNLGLIEGFGIYLHPLFQPDQSRSVP